MVRFAYRHVRPADDVKHEGVFSPGMRDHAESARSVLVNALLNAKGEEGWAAKLEMAKDPQCAHFKDRIVAVAEEHWAQEVDSVAFDETQAVALDQAGDAPPSTNEGMFALMNDRLADLDVLLESDVSPKETWAGIAEEKLMRREISRALVYAAKEVYTVKQESVTGEEKETDICLCSVVSEHEAVIELKLAENWSGKELRDAIYGQLVKKYMAAENRKSGCLLVTVASEKKWKHPDNGTLVGVGGLKSLLREEAKRVEGEVGEMVAIGVHVLDLRPPDEGCARQSPVRQTPAGDSIPGLDLTNRGLQ